MTRVKEDPADFWQGRTEQVGEQDMRLIWGAAVFGAIGIMTACAQIGVSGQAIYNENCAMCHGPGGKGDGDFAGKLLKLPQDLTVLTVENGGTYPRLRVTEAIAGKGRGDHFSGAMPEFSEMMGTGAMADARLEAVVDYLESLQVSG